MTYAKVKQIFSFEGKLEQYKPEDQSNFCISIRMIVGPSAGEESFDLKGCTPSYLAELCEKSKFIVGRHYLIVGNYNFEFITTLIIKLVERCSGESWLEIAGKVGRIGYWEFEDYQASAH